MRGCFFLGGVRVVAIWFPPNSFVYLCKTKVEHKRIKRYEKTILDGSMRVVRNHSHRNNREYVGRGIGIGYHLIVGNDTELHMGYVKLGVSFGKGSKW